MAMDPRHVSDPLACHHVRAVKYPGESDGGGVLAQMEQSISGKVHEDFDWLEEELGKGNGKVLG